MRSFLLFVVQLTFRLLPDTKFFGYKRLALRLAGVKVGKDVRVCSSVRIIGDSLLSIGNNTWIGHGTWIFCSAPIQIGKNVNVAPLCYIGTGTHQIDPSGASIAGKGVSSPIIVEDGAWLCARSTILAGIRIGEKAIVGAGAVVINDVPTHTVIGGIPAKVLRQLDE